MMSSVCSEAVLEPSQCIHFLKTLAPQDTTPPLPEGNTVNRFGTNNTEKECKFSFTSFHIKYIH